MTSVIINSLHLYSATLLFSKHSKRSTIVKGVSPHPHKNVFIRGLKMNENVKGLDRHDDRIFFFGRIIPVCKCL